MLYVTVHTYGGSAHTVDEVMQGQLIIDGRVYARYRRSRNRDRIMLPQHGNLKLSSVISEDSLMLLDGNTLGKLVVILLVDVIYR